MLGASWQSWFSQPWVLWLLLALPLWQILRFWQARRQRFRWQQFGNWHTVQSQFLVHASNRRWQIVLLHLAILLMIIGSAGIQWGRELGDQTTQGRDLVIVLDTSRSMLAEQPTRLERARRILLDFLQNSKQQRGLRVALVLFAGQAKVVCPLTRDFAHVQSVIEALDDRYIPPELQPDAKSAVSGTRIGMALETAIELLDPKHRGSQNLLLISDGVDPVDDGEWLDGVSTASKKSLSVDVVGVGDPTEQTKIPYDDHFLRFGGKDVLTQLSEDLLKDIAARTNGVYIPAETRTIPFAALYGEVLNQRQKERILAEDNLVIYKQRSHWFFLLAIVLLVGALALSDWRAWQFRSQEF